MEEKVWEGIGEHAAGRAGKGYFEDRAGVFQVIT